MRKDYEVRDYMLRRLYNDLDTGISRQKIIRLNDFDTM